MTDTPARPLTVACAQMACGWDVGANLDRAEVLIRRAAGQGARLILIQELVETPYFPIEQHPEHFRLAQPLAQSAIVQRFQALAAELGVVLPASFFERAGPAYFNSVAMIDAGGQILGVYRKSHIPNAVGYQEKTYFSPGDTGFKVWDTAVGNVGVGICWDQWFPEAARAMALMGAEILLYPTAIGSEPADPRYNSAGAWQRVMQGHAVANTVPVVAANRIGREAARYAEGLEMTFYGCSFIANWDGAMLAEAGDEEALLVATVDLDAIAMARANWGLFRDRRPDLYQPLAHLGPRAI